MDLDDKGVVAQQLPPLSNHIQIVFLWNLNRKVDQAGMIIFADGDRSK